MDNTITGRIWVFGDDVDTDVIYPGKYLPILDSAEMALHALEGVDPKFPGCIESGDILVAGVGFGCGSSREQAAACLKAAGIGAVVAVSFARIFFRNAINLGLPIVQADVNKLLRDGDQITIDFLRSRIQISSEEFSFPPLHQSVMDILNAGGLIPAVRSKLGITS